MISKGKLRGDVAAAKTMQSAKGKRGVKYHRTQKRLKTISKLASYLRTCKM